MNEGEPPIIYAPELNAGHWINTGQAVQMRTLRGQVVLVFFWDYSDINCLRALPYINEWYNRYHEKGLTIIGVHTPQFSFGRERTQIEEAAQELNIRFPVLLDNDYQIWKAYQNPFWPAKYLIDQQGAIRFQSYGDGHYSEFEAALQTLLHEVNPRLVLPAVMQPLHEEELPGKRPTRDLRSGLMGGSLGNPEGYGGYVPILYRLPDEREPGAFYVAGAWQAADQYLVYQGQTGGLIQIPYEAIEVYAVLSPHHDTVERTLHPQTVSIEVWQDDRPIVSDRRGVDITQDGRLLVNRPRTYNLIRNPRLERHELTLRVKSRGFTIYAFSFTGGV